MIALNLATLAIAAGLVPYARRRLPALAQPTNDPQHFGADVGGVGNGRVDLHHGGVLK